MMLRTFARLALLPLVMLTGLQVVQAQAPPAIAEPSHRPISASAKTSAPDLKLQFSFREAAWERVFSWLAEKANLTLDLTDLPPGTFNYQDDREHTIAEAMDAINGYLLPRGYVTLRRNQFLVVLKTDNPILPNLIPTISAQDLEDYGNNELLRILVPVEGFKPSEVAEQVQQFLGTFGKASPVDASQAVLLQGFGKSLRVAEALLSSAQTPATDDELTFRSFPLKHISAADAERQIQKLFGLGTNPFTASLARRESYFQRRREGDDGHHDESAQRPSPVPLMQHLAMNMKVSALGRTNSLLVAATPSAIKLVESILASIDVQHQESEREFLDDSTPVLRVYSVSEADEDDVAETINAILPGVVLNEDGRHDSIHVYATALEHKEVEKLIGMIDQGGAGGGLEVISLFRNDPYQMGQLLNSLFINEDREDRPVITPEIRSQSLVVRATSSQMAAIKKTLAAYGETNSVRSDDSGSDTASSRFRKVSVPNGRAEWIARAVRDVMSEDQQFGNPIRIVVPSDVSKKSAEGTSSNPFLRTRRIPLSDEDRSKPMDEPGAIRTVVTETQVSTTSETACEGNEAATESETPERPRVTIEVRDGELFMYSNDGKALDEIEGTIRELIRQMPTRTNWTVFYLRAATASDTATQLGQLLRDENDPFISIGMPTAAESRLPVGVQTVRLIPDSRTNAIFISGPDAKVQEAEKFLELLDTIELPQSQRDRLPRTIAVEHADVNEVAGMVRELYKDYLEDPAERRAQNQRDNRQGNDDRRVNVERQGDTPQSPGIRLTIAVDTQSSELIVSCNESLFQQIEDLVKTRDVAALASRPQFQILTLQPESAQSIAESLNGLSTKISVGLSSAATNRQATNRPQVPAPTARPIPSRPTTTPRPSFRITPRPSSSNNRR